MTAKKPKELKPLPTPPATQVAPVTYALALALRALHQGKADEAQQRMVLDWIVQDAAGRRHFPYHPGDRDTAFALGRYFVAEQIVGLLHADLTSLRGPDAEA